MAQPVINPGVIGSDKVWVESFADEFDKPDGPLEGNTTTFKFINMDDSDGNLHNTGNRGQDRDGDETGSKVKGKRWSAWYDDFHDQTSFYENNQLVMGAFASNQPDPTRIAYTQGIRDDITGNPSTINVAWNSLRIYTSFLSTWDREHSNAAGGQVEASDSPGVLFGPGQVIEFRANFGEMSTRSLRWSAYLLPEQYDEINLAYNGIPSTGVEVDWPEIDKTPGFENTLLEKVISDGTSAGNTPNGTIDVLIDFGIQVESGWHTHSIVWLETGLYWLVDGIEVQRDEIRVPLSRHYLVFSRELNSGAKDFFGSFKDDQAYSAGEYKHHDKKTYQANQNIPTPGPFNPTQWDRITTQIDPVSIGQQAHDLVAVYPKIPPDSGLYGHNAWVDIDNIVNPVGAGDVARIDYLRAWTLGDGTEPPVDPPVVPPVDPPVTTVIPAGKRKVYAAPALGGVNDTSQPILQNADETIESYLWQLDADNVEFDIEGGINNPSAIIRSTNDVLVPKTTNLILNISDTTMPHITGPNFITQDNMTFNWNPGNETVEAYKMHVGASRGGTEYMDSGELTGSILQSANTTPFPFDGNLVYALLSYKIAGVWHEEDRIYKGRRIPQIIQPTPNSTIVAGIITVRFTWFDAPGVSHIMSVGTPDDKTKYWQSTITSGIEFNNAQNLPRDGSVVMITVDYAHADGVFDLVNKTFKAYYVSK